MAPGRHTVPECRRALTRSVNRVIGIDHPMDPFADSKPGNRGSSGKIPRPVESDVEHIGCAGSRRKIDIGELAAENKAPPVRRRRQRRTHGHQGGQPHDSCQTRWQHPSQDNGADKPADGGAAEIGEDPIDPEPTPGGEGDAEKGCTDEARHPAHSSGLRCSGIAEGTHDQRHQEHHGGRSR